MSQIINVSVPFINVGTNPNPIDAVNHVEDPGILHPTHLGI